ncbi:MAG: zinc ribbon domain-containing protein [Myxococcota bacterium]|nr:zinc ribbon domain-containing protein [Myxococcota bacterium]
MCSKANDADAGFCKACGQALGDSTCSSCGLAQDADAVFCKRCGARLKPPTTPT